MNKRNIVFSLVVLLLLIGGTIWALHARASAQMQKVRDMGNELFAGNGPPDPAKMEELQKEAAKLTEKQRTTLMDEGRKKMERRMDDMLDEYYSMPAEKQKELLDKQIKEMEAGMKRMASARPPKGPPPGMGQPPKGGGMPGPGGPNWTPEKRHEWRNQMLDHTTPDHRAKFTGYIAALVKRRTELGLPAFPAPPRPRTK
jgi:hypothetical protein